MKKRKSSKKKPKNGFDFPGFLRISSLLLPPAIYIFSIALFFPGPNSGFIVLGCAGTLFIGIGLSNLAGLIDGMYFGHMFSVTSILAGIFMIGVSSAIMYIPSLYSMVDEKYVTFYFMMLVFLTMPIIWYTLFRGLIKSIFRYRRISKTDINHSLRGKRNYWWYEDLHRKHNLGILYYLNKIFTILYPLTAFAHLLIGWNPRAVHLISVLFIFVCIISSVMWIVGISVPTEKPKGFATEVALCIILPFAMCYAVITYMSWF